MSVFKVKFFIYLQLSNFSKFNEHLWTFWSIQIKLLLKSLPLQFNQLSNSLIRLEYSEENEEMFFKQQALILTTTAQ